MEAKLTFKYDRAGDILYIIKDRSLSRTRIRRIGGRGHPEAQPKSQRDLKSRSIIFSTRLLRSDLFELPVTGELRLAGKN